MEQNAEQVTKDNVSKYNFKKSKELAPEGYEWVCNTLKFEQYTNEYKSKEFVILPEAYNMFGKLLKDNVGIYKLKS